MGFFWGFLVKLIVLLVEMNLKYRFEGYIASFLT